MKFVRPGVLSLLLAVLILPSLAMAAPRTYVGVHGGYTVLSDAGAGYINDANFKDGYLAGVTAGYLTNVEKGYVDARLEAEFSYRENDLENAEFLGNRVSAGGSVSSQSLMGNAYCVFKTTTFVEPFVHIGLGVARLDVAEAEVAGVTFIDDDGYNFAYQIGAGLAFVLTDSLGLDFGYRLFRVANTELEDATGKDFSLSYKTQNLYLGLSYAF